MINALYNRDLEMRWRRGAILDGIWLFFCVTIISFGAFALKKTFQQELLCDDSF